MLSIHRHDSVTVLHFSGGREEALRLAEAISGMGESLTVGVPDPREGEKTSAMTTRCVEARSLAEKLFGSKVRPLRAKVFDSVPDKKEETSTTGPMERPDPDAGAEEEQAVAALLAEEKAKKEAEVAILKDLAEGTKARGGDSSEPEVKVGDGQVGAGVTVG